MAKSETSLFLESLKLWDRPLSELRPRGVFQPEDDLDRIVDEFFDRFVEGGRERSGRDG